MDASELSTVTHYSFSIIFHFMFFQSCRGDKVVDNISDKKAICGELMI